MEQEKKNKLEMDPNKGSYREHRKKLEEVKRRGREERRLRREQEKEKKSSSSSDDDDLIIEALAHMGINTDQPGRSEGTGLIYDERMVKHQNLWDPEFPERPERLLESFKRIQHYDLDKRCMKLEARHGTEDQILSLHSRELLEVMKSTVGMSIDELKDTCMKYEDVYINNDTFEACLLAIGSTQEIMENILKKKIRNGLALVRPPGHHAMHNDYCGFCFFNNVAIAAKKAIDDYGLKRVLIVDWDVHHGQASQQMFYEDPRVLYFSIHRYDYGTFWPELRESDYDFIGEGEGKGYNANVPLNMKKMTDSDYLAIFHQLLMPMAYEYKPDLVLVSAGYDAAIGCPEFDPDLVLVSSGYDAAIGDWKGEMLVTPVAYAHMTHHLMGLAEGRIAVILEGGYCLKSLSEAVAMTLRTLLGDPCPVLPPNQEPCQSITSTILNCIKVLHPYWKCFQYQTPLEAEELCPFPEVNTLPPKEGVEFVSYQNKPTHYSLSYSYPEKVTEMYLKQNCYDADIDKLISEAKLTVPPHKCCIVYDEGMRVHRAVTFIGHPEDPDRITSIFDLHVKWGLAERCLRVPSREATEVEILKVHSNKHLEHMHVLEELTPQELRKKQYSFNSIYLCKETNIAAKLSAGCVLSVADAVLSGQATSGVAIVRPPGHHAEQDTPMGFCFYNNVAITARYAQNKYGIKRVLILDWDVHHGNGTQHTFYDDPSVLVISLHRYDNGTFYPMNEDGNHNKVGKGPGEGYNVNIAWNQGSMGDAEYIAAFQQIVMPIAYQYGPELVLVSAGFDAAMGDPLGGYCITPAGYGHMVHMLSTLANGRVIMALEGGYNLRAISHSMATCTSVLLGDPCPFLPYQPPSESGVKCICNVLDTHKKYWSCLKFRVSIPIESPHREPEDEGEQLIAEGDFSDSMLRTEREATKKHTEIDDITFKLQQTSVSRESPTNTLTSSPAAEKEIKKPSDTDEKDEDLLGAVGGTDQPTVASVFGSAFSAAVQLGVDQMFAVQPRSWCPHLTSVQPLPGNRDFLDSSAPCEDCGNEQENWICLVCYKVFCSRYVNEHMMMHSVSESHLVTLSYSDLSVWCYGCDDYIDNEVLMPAKRAAHRHKFGMDLPYGCL